MTKLELFLNKFILNKITLMDLQSRIDHAFTKGLSGEHDEFFYRALKMENSFLCISIDGTENGRFLSVDLGGTNLRFVEIHVENGFLKPSFVLDKIPNSLLSGTGDQLFDYIAGFIKKSLEDKGLIDQEIPYVGFTFSFPCTQLQINSGLLIRWTKGFSVSGVEGKDVVLLLKQACDRKNVKIKDFILLNDTTGTLMCSAFEHRNSRIGVINGTGTNACYLEKSLKVTKSKSPIESETVIINTEWGSFGENGELDDILTSVDKELDKSSINPGQQLFEKMISGMYLGEIVRLIILKLFEQNLLFKDGFPKLLKEKNSFETFMISDSYLDNNFVQKFDHQFNYNLNDEDFNIIRRICDIITRRSANLCAVGLAALLQRSDVKKTVIGADGSMFTKHPVFKDYVKETVKIISPNKKFKIEIVSDGSGKGAALSALQATIHYPYKQKKTVESKTL